MDEDIIIGVDLAKNVWLCCKVFSMRSLSSLVRQESGCDERFHRAAFLR